MKQNISKLFVLGSCRDLLLNSKFVPKAADVPDEAAVELRKDDIRCLVREIEYKGYPDPERIGTYLMVQISIRDPSLAGTGDPLEWPCPFGGYLGPSGVTEDTNARRLFFHHSNTNLAREQVERVLLPWIMGVANMEWLRLLYEKRVEELNPRPILLGLLTRRVKERPLWHYYLSLLRWHCGDKVGAVNEAQRYFELLPDDKHGARWFKWVNCPR